MLEAPDAPWQDRPRPVRPGFAYVASPYSDPNPKVRQARYDAAVAFVAWCYASGWVVYSPIVHTHPPALIGQLPTDAAFWWRVNETMLAVATEVIVLKIQGWDRSAGVAQEIAEAERTGLAARLFEPVDDFDPRFEEVLRLGGKDAPR